MVGKTKIQQSSLCALTTEKSKVQRLDTDIANMTAESTQLLADKICTINFAQK